jgi:hypothetical protein
LFAASKPALWVSIAEVRRMALEADLSPRIRMAELYFPYAFIAQEFEFR